MMTIKLGNPMLGQSQAVMAALLICLAGCFGEHTSFSRQTGDGTIPPDKVIETSSGLITQTWTQVSDREAKADVLFILDTTGSMSNEINGLIATLPGFVQTLIDDGIDLCVGVTLAEPKPDVKFHLVAASGIDKVLCILPGDNTSLFLQRLTANLNHAKTVGDGYPEGPLMAAMRAVTNFANHYISHGFFRPDSTFAPIMISDENDLSESMYPTTAGLSCTNIPVQYRNFDPIGRGVIRPNCAEADRRYLYYGQLKEDGRRHYLTYLEIADEFLQPGVIAKFLPSVIGYLSEEAAQQFGGGNEAEKAYGTLDFVELFGGPTVPLELAKPEQQAQFNAALEDVAQNVGQSAKIITEFRLESAACVPPAIQVYVDDVAITSFQYFPHPINEIVLAPRDAGSEGSTIKIIYQKQGTGGCLDE